MEPEPSLAKLARSLEKTGPGANGETLNELWRLLTKSVGSEYHAIEETVLRWLLKVMNGPAGKPQAETVRRYPLTWNILDHVFSRIPLFSLAKSLSDRKFISVLQSTLKDISGSASVASSAEGGKRKRSQDATFDLAVLKTAECSFDSAESVMAALATLITRIDSRDLSSRDRMGAEHIKSLFASPVNETLDLIMPILNLASIIISTSCDEQRLSQDKWIATMSSIWDLHRIGATDALEIATASSHRILQLLSRLDPGSSDVQISASTRAAWSYGLDIFYTRAVIYPARTAFLNDGNIDILTAIVSAIQTDAISCAPILYTLSLDAPDLTVSSLKSRESWQQQVFSAVEGIFEAQYNPDKPIAMQRILGIAKSREASIQRDSLQNVCKNYVLESDSTHWTVLVRVLACDRHVVFQSYGETVLAEELCRRASIVGSDDTFEAGEVQQAVRQIKQAYAESRDLKAFWKLWYAQICFCEAKQSLETSPWLDDALRHDSSTASGIESHMTPTQLSDLLEWLSTQTPIQSGARYILLDAITTQIRSPDFTDPTVSAIMNLTLETFPHINTLPSLKILRWRILSKVVPWISAADRSRIWNEVHDEVNNVTIKGALESDDALEAFSFLNQLWLYVYPDGENEPEVSEMALKVAKSLAKEGKKSKKSSLPSSFPSPYLDLAVKVSSRLISLLSAKSGDFPKFIQKNIIDVDSPDASTFDYLAGLVANENILNDRKLVDHLINALISILSSGKSSENMASAISVLARIPDDCFSRVHRGTIMKTGISLFSKSSTYEPSLWKTTLNLMNKMMKRSTFYEGICFGDLISLADSASAVFSLKDKARTLQEVYGLDILFTSLCSAIIKQMTTHFEEWGRAFLADANKFVDKCSSEFDYLKTHHLRITLLQALIDTVKSITLKEESAFNLEDAEKLLMSMVKTPILEYYSEPKLGRSFPYVVLAAIDASKTVQESVAKICKLKSKSKKLMLYANEGISQGTFLGWKLRAFLTRSHRESIEVTGQFFKGTASEDERAPDFLASSDYEPLLQETLECTAAPMEGPELLSFFHSVIDGLSSSTDPELQLKAIGICTSIVAVRQDAEADTESAISVPYAYDKVLRIALTAPNGRTFAKACQILRLLLNGSSARLKQWNIEQTLAMISEVSSASATVTAAIKDSPVVYDWLCRLLEAILRRFRIRLDGRLHILVATLQSLLSGLLLSPYDARIGRWATQPVNIRVGDFSHWSKHASAYTRLLTLVCEPMAASVARHKQNPMNALDTATDIAKRAAGRQMYLILVSYVKLQLQVDVPRAVRDELELGMNSIFDITPPEVRKILNDSLDMSGRAILGTQYKRYKQFGKWSGV